MDGVEVEAGRRRWVHRFVAVLGVLALLVPVAPSVSRADDAAIPVPAKVTIGPRSDLAVITWTSPDAAGWLVEVSPEYTFRAPRKVTATGTIAVVADLEPATTYFARVRTLGQDSYGEPSASVVFTTKRSPYPAAAPTLEVEADTTTSVVARWPEIAVAAAYEVEYGVEPTLREVERATAEQPKQRLKKLERGTTYFLRVRAVDAAGQPVSEWSPIAEATTPDQVPLRVASFNVLCANCSKGKASWADRRGAVVATIKDQDPDVLGVQEASQGRIAGGGSQYMDLVNRLGDPYRITDTRRGASLAVRIIYNSDRVELLEKGSAFLPKGKSRRAATWAIFRQKATGERFFFLSTHFEPTNDKKGSRTNYNTRRRQANAVVDIIRRNNPDELPVIAVGDYNSTKWEKPSNGPYDVMENAGYLDPLGNGHRTRGTAPGAFVEKRINTSYASYNMYTRKARNFPGQLTGSNPDYIFVSPMRVSEYETVVNVDSSGRWVGTIPSDHNMIRATVWLP
ncbi:MAG: endonuclease/exonuclease/phosphatase family protein [Propionicimonas sp.]